MLTTNRLKFVTVDTSYSVPQPSAIIGATTIRAPKGSTKPTFVNKNDTTSVLQLFGTPSSTYPDVQNVLDYIQNYGMWISAPPGAGLGTGTTDKSYFGGAYLTTLGSLEPFYLVTEDENGEPVFLNGKRTLVTAGNVASAFTVAGSAPNFATNTLTVDALDPSYFTAAKVSNITISYPRDPATFSGSANIVCTISGSNITTTSPDDVTNTPIVIGTLENSATPGKIKMVLIGSATSYTTGSVNSKDILFTDATQNTYLEGIEAQISVKYTQDITTQTLCYFYQNSPRVMTSNTSGILKLTKLDPVAETALMSYSEVSYGTRVYSKTFTVSTNINKADGFNTNLFIENIIGPGLNNFFVGKACDGRSFTESVIVSVEKSLQMNGQRWASNASFVEATHLDSLLTAGWDASVDNEYLNTNIYFDNSGLDSVSTKFANMRASYNKTATYIMPIKVPLAPASAESAVTTVVSAIKAERSGKPMTTGVAYYCNELFFKEGYNGTSFWITPMGAIAAMESKIMEYKLGGVAPFFTNEGNPSLGGQISFSASRQKYNFNATHLDDLDAAGINPVIRDINYGVMLMSQRTGQDPLVLSDWSSLGHTMAFDLVYREISQNVMFPQLGKPIDDVHMTMRREQTEIILARRTSGPTRIWDSALVQVEEVNTPETKAQKNFILKVRVKVYPFSEYVTLEFDTIGQTETV